VTAGRLPPAWLVTAGRRRFRVRAWTAGEARALARRELQLPRRWRLPPWVRVEREG
jgi:hypothetical protein